MRFKSPLLQASLIPLIGLVLGLFLIWSFEFLAKNYDWALPSLSAVKGIFITLMLAWFLLRWKNLFITNLQSTRHERSFIKGLRLTPQ